ncbi:MAG: glycosyltransferase [Bdellovibrionaceae bacterium]|nr:glycosyltransferase [Pseudobdellovibrionaceae bacterium]
MLTVCLRSIFKQGWPVQIFLLNHSNNEIDLTNYFSLSEREKIKLVNLGHLKAKRGAPLNIGLKLAMEAAQEREAYLAFLDDDDIVYPQFLATLVSEAARTGKTLVYGASFKRVDDAEPEFAFGYRPTMELFVNNFIPINSYVLSLNNLKKDPVYFDESLEVLEDWKFLIELVLKKHKFGYVDSVISEFSVRTDGSNSLNQNSVKHWENCEKEIETFVRGQNLELSGDTLMDFGVYFKNNQERKILVPKHKLIPYKKSFYLRALEKFRKLFLSV